MPTMQGLRRSSDEQGIKKPVKEPSPPRATFVLGSLGSNNSSSFDQLIKLPSEVSLAVTGAAARPPPIPVEKKPFEHVLKTHVKIVPLDFVLPVNFERYKRHVIYHRFFIDNCLVWIWPNQAPRLIR